MLKIRCVKQHLQLQRQKEKYSENPIPKIEVVKKRYQENPTPQKTTKM